MKFVDSFSLIKWMIGLSLLLTLSGCATPVDLSQYDSHLSRLTGMNYAQAKFMSLCVFNIVDGENKYIDGYDGVVALDTNTITLAVGNHQHGDPDDRYEFKISDLEGVALSKFGLSRQLQIQVSQGQIIVADMSNGTSFSDSDATERLYHLLLEMGVRKWESPRHFLYKADIYFVPVY